MKIVNLMAAAAVAIGGWATAYAADEEPKSSDTPAASSSTSDKPAGSNASTNKSTDKPSGSSSSSGSASGTSSSGDTPSTSSSNTSDQPQASGNASTSGSASTGTAANASGGVNAGTSGSSSNPTASGSVSGNVSTPAGGASAKVGGQAGTAGSTPTAGASTSGAAQAGANMPSNSASGSARTSTSGQSSTTSQDPASTSANTNANSNTSANPGNNANVNSNTNANADVNAGVSGNAKLNAATNLNAAANAAQNINAQTATRVSSSLGLNWAATAANAGLTIANLTQSTAFRGVGFMPGDQIVSVGGQTIANPVDFARYVYTVQPGQRVPIIVTRNGVQQTLYWTPDQQFVQLLPQEYRAASVMPAAPDAEYLGIRLDPREQQAVVVASVAPNSPAAEAGVRSGDMITAVNRTPVHTPAEFVDIASQLGPNDPVQLSLNRVQNVNVSPVQRTSVVVDVTPVAPAPAAPGVVVPAGRPVRVAPAPGGPVRRIIRGRP